jgi:hypothetical protein
MEDMDMEDIMILLLALVSFCLCCPLRSYFCHRDKFSCNSLLFHRKYDNRFKNTTWKALNLGFSAVNAIGNGLRESRQNEMIYQERAELSASREREAEMAARIRQLELMQAGAGGGQQQQQPQIIIAQPAPVVAVPAQ